MFRQLSRIIALMTIRLSDTTWERVRELFPPEQQSEAVQLLEGECGNNLPFLQNLDAQGLEPVRFAALQ